MKSRKTLKGTRRRARSGTERVRGGASKYARVDSSRAFRPYLRHPWEQPIISNRTLANTHTHSHTESHTPKHTHVLQSWINGTHTMSAVSLRDVWIQDFVFYPSRSWLFPPSPTPPLDEIYMHVLDMPIYRVIHTIYQVDLATLLLS